MMIRFSRVLKDILHYMFNDIDLLTDMNNSYPMIWLGQILMALKQK